MSFQAGSWQPSVFLKGQKMNENLFRKLIGQKESETLDFKESGYDLSENRGRNDFIKDLIAMANTPRDQSAHIIFGVRWTPKEDSTVVGLKQQFDDAELQRALGNRVQPNPRFIYTPLRLTGNRSAYWKSHWRQADLTHRSLILTVCKPARLLSPRYGE